MGYEVEQHVTVTAKILKQGDTGAASIELNDEPGVIKKVDGDHVYVKTQHGTHYLHQNRVKAVAA